ncbi:hypothetical protein MY1884_004443 [Beauveria asiatica]
MSFAYDDIGIGLPSKMHKSGSALISSEVYGQQW